MDLDTLETEEFFTTDGRYAEGRFSPDGRWFAGTSGAEGAGADLGSGHFGWRARRWSSPLASGRR